MVLQGSKRTRFSLRTDFDVNTLSRILEILTIRDMAPEMLSTRRVDQLQYIELTLVDLNDHDVFVIENKMRQVITVLSVKSETLVSLKEQNHLPEAA